MAFQGSLSELPLPDILQLVAVSGKTGSFTIRNGRETGEIFLREGQMVHAETGRLVGEEAIYELAIWPEGEFVFQPGEIEVETSIQKSNTSLLMEAARRIDEWQVLARRVPSTSLVPLFSEEGGASTVSLSPQEWAVVRKIDERRTIDEIAGDLDTSPFEVAKVVYGLIAHGLVTLPAERHDLPLDRLEGLPEERLREVASAVLDLTRRLLSGHARAAEIDARLVRMKPDAAEEVSSGQVAELVREAESSVSTARGPHRARAFADGVAELLVQPQEVQ